MPFGLAIRDHIENEVTVRVGKWTAPIDREIAPLVRTLWKRGVETISSCQGYDTAAIAFRSRRHVRAFRRLVKDFDGASILIGYVFASPFARSGKRYWVANFPREQAAAMAHHINRLPREE